MAAYRRKDRPTEGFRVWPTLPGFGRVGPWQTGLRQKRAADDVERWLAEQALSRPALIEGLIRGDFSLREVWVAKLRSTREHDRVEDLLRNASDPPLSAAAETYRGVAADARVRDGLLRLAGLALEVERRRAAARNAAEPRAESLRLSWLLTPSNLTELYRVAEEGQSAAGVRRSVHRAASELVSHNFGKARVRDLMLDVAKPAVADEREVRVAPDEIRRLLTEFWQMEPLFHDFVALAILLAVDRTPLMRIRPRFFDEDAGTLEVFDTKTGNRHRVLVLSAPAIAILRRVCGGRGPDETVFPWTEGAIRHRWEAGRDRAVGQPSRNRRERGAERAQPEIGAPNIVTLPSLRFKDLRHILPTAWNALKLPEAELQNVLGHAPGSTMTRRYITPAGERANLDQVAAHLGLDRLHLRAAGA